MQKYKDVRLVVSKDTMKLRAEIDRWQELGYFLLGPVGVGVSSGLPPEYVATMVELEDV